MPTDDYLGKRVNNPADRPEPVDGRRRASRSWFDKLAASGPRVLGAAIVVSLLAHLIVASLPQPPMSGPEPLPMLSATITEMPPPPTPTVKHPTLKRKARPAAPPVIAAAAPEVPLPTVEAEAWPTPEDDVPVAKAQPEPAPEAVAPPELTGTTIWQVEEQVLAEPAIGPGGSHCSPAAG